MWTKAIVDRSLRSVRFHRNLTEVANNAAGVKDARFSPLRVEPGAGPSRLIADPTGHLNKRTPETAVR